MARPLFWTCDKPEPRASDATLCDNCDGVPLIFHPVDICTGCNHRVEWHGKESDGCARMGAGGWCDCRRTFGRTAPDFSHDAI